MKTLLALIILLTFTPAHTFAAWVATENFDSYANGDLTGKNSGTGFSAAWSGNVAYDTQTTVVAQGTDATLVNFSATEPEIGRALTTATTDGVVHISMRRDSTTQGNYHFCLNEGGGATANRVACVAFHNDGKIKLKDGATEVQAYSANTWYDIDMEYDCSTDTFRVSINGGPYSTAATFRTVETNLTHLMHRTDATGSASNNYSDDIRPGSAAASFKFWQFDYF